MIYKGYFIVNVSEDASFPWYRITNTKLENFGEGALPSELKAKIDEMCESEEEVRKFVDSLHLNENVEHEGGFVDEHGQWYNIGADGHRYYRLDRHEMPYMVGNRRYYPPYCSTCEYMHPAQDSEYHKNVRMRDFHGEGRFLRDTIEAAKCYCKYGKIGLRNPYWGYYEDVVEPDKDNAEFDKKTKKKWDENMKRALIACDSRYLSRKGALNRV